jgi:sugar/nucleoside kinase (ribokinase family)
MPREFFPVDSLVDRVVDPVGAGDALLAYSSLALAADGNFVLATILGALGAAVECEHEGNRPVSPAEVEEKLDDLERRIRYEVSRLAVARA